MRLNFPVVRACTREAPQLPEKVTTKLATESNPSGTS